MMLVIMERTSGVNHAVAPSSAPKTAPKISPTTILFTVPCLLLTLLFRVAGSSFKDFAQKTQEISRRHKPPAARAAPHCVWQSDGRAARAIPHTPPPRARPEIFRSRATRRTHRRTARRDAGSSPWPQLQLARDARPRA